MTKKLLLFTCIANMCFGMHVAESPITKIKNLPNEIHNKILEYLPDNPKTLLIFGRHREISPENALTIAKEYTQAMKNNIQANKGYESFSPIFVTTHCRQSSVNIANALTAQLNSIKTDNAFGNDISIQYYNATYNTLIEEEINLNQITPQDMVSQSAFLFLLLNLQKNNTSAFWADDVPYSFCFRLPKKLATTINNVRVAGYGRDSLFEIANKLQVFGCCLKPFFILVNPLGIGG